MFLVDFMIPVKIVSIIFTLFFLLFVGVLLYTQLELISRNATMIEDLLDLDEMKRHFDLGSARKNFMAVLGVSNPLLLLLHPIL